MKAPINNQNMTMAFSLTERKKNHSKQPTRDHGICPDKKTKVNMTTHTQKAVRI